VNEWMNEWIYNIYFLPSSLLPVHLFVFNLLCANATRK
jgi:hypothetical protein